jgi:hypothetical protein
LAGSPKVSKATRVGHWTRSYRVDAVICISTTCRAKERLLPCP